MLSCNGIRRNALERKRRNNNPHDIIDYEGSEYAALLPVSEGVEDGEKQEVLILLVCSEDDDDVSFEVVEDFGTVEKIFAVFRERNADLFNFE